METDQEVLQAETSENAESDQDHRKLPSAPTEKGADPLDEGAEYQKNKNRQAEGQFRVS